MKLPHITKKQQEILELLYAYRFLSRIQVQALLGHKDKKTINLWLKDLRAKQYVEWIYSTDFTEKTKPAIYYLGINGVRFLKTVEEYPIDEVRKRYREATRSQSYIDRCLLIADCCISLEQARNTSKGNETWYYFETEADYLKDSYYHFLSDSELIHPQLCFSKEQSERASEPETKESYLLEIFDASLPRYRLKYRLKKYVEWLDEEAADWADQTENAPLPIILLACANITDLIYAKRRTRGLMADIWERDDEERPRVWFTTAEKLKEQGVKAQGIWEVA